MLNSDGFAKAKDFINLNARDLDKALFEYEFNSESKEKVIASLAKYQNSDGGFGYGIEPDIQMSESSVIATTVAFQYMDLIDLDPDHHMIKSGINYFLDRIMQFEDQSPLSSFWYPVDMMVNKAPHAPWWHREELNPPKLEMWSNPSVEVIGYLNKYPDYVNKHHLKKLNNDLQTFMKTTQKLSGFVYYDYLCWKRTMSKVGKELLDNIFKMMDNTFHGSELLLPEKFEEMKIQWFVTEKSSYLYQKYPEIIESLFEKEISRQRSDGGWYPTWKWGDDKDLWNKIEKEWAGKITVHTLSVLKYMELM